VPLICFSGNFKERAMSKILFFNIPAYGHTNPTLPLVAELVHRGEQVIYYSSEAFADAPFPL